MLSFSFEWSQTEASLTVVVSLAGAQRRGLDLFVSDLLLKAYAPGRLLLLDLHAAVCDDRSSVSLGEQAATFVLPKARAPLHAPRSAAARLACAEWSKPNACRRSPASGPALWPRATGRRSPRAGSRLWSAWCAAWTPAQRCLTDASAERTRSSRSRAGCRPGRHAVRRRAGG